MLFRAYVYTRYPILASELAVFFEAPCSSDAPKRLQALLATTWGCSPQQVEHYNLFSELDLRGRHDGRCFERGADADTLLLESGFGPEGPSYSRRESTMLLVSPRWHARLLAAQELVDKRLVDRAINAEVDRLRSTTYGARRVVAQVVAQGVVQGMAQGVPA